MAFDDIPKAFKAEVKDVFDVNAQLPREWLDKVSARSTLVVIL